MYLLNLEQSGISERLLPIILEYLPISGFYKKICVRKCKTNVSGCAV
jgi:hypothetical protein